MHAGLFCWVGGKGDGMLLKRLVSRPRPTAACRCVPPSVVAYPRVHIFQEEATTVVDFIMRPEYSPGDEDVLREYMRDVGCAINVSVLDRRTLRDKLDRPWLYPELVIRVNGRSMGVEAAEDPGA